MSWGMGSVHSEAAKLLWNHRDRYYPRARWAEVRGDHPSTRQGTKTGCHPAAGLRLLAYSCLHKQGHCLLLSASPELRVTERRKEGCYFLQHQGIGIPVGARLPAPLDSLFSPL